LFAGNRQESRFSNLLKLALTDLTSTPSHFGTHSLRKGAANFLQGIADFVNAVAMILRAGWSLGNTKDRYKKSIYF
jgi:hypothetical protein